MAEKLTDLPGLSDWESHNRVTVDGIQYTPSQLEASRVKSGTDMDVYNAAAQRAAVIASNQAPTVSISNGTIQVSAPKSILDSPYVNQLTNELQSLKGVDLASPETQNAINKLNSEILTNFENAAVQSTIGWSPEEYKDYQYAIQTVSGTNPMKSSNIIKGRDKEGKIVSKTPQDWVDYWRKIYNTDERIDAFSKSYQSSDPYERTMALVMGQGSSTPVYGFDALEQTGQALAAFGNQMKKFPEGLVRLFGTDSNTRRVESLAKQLNVPTEALQNIRIQNESQFNSMKDSIRGKTWGELSDEQKAFILEIGVSKENKYSNEAARSIAAGTPLGRSTDDLTNMSSSNETNSRLAIDNILQNTSFDKYKEVRDNYTTWQNYDKDLNQDDERLAKNAIAFTASQGLGNMAGTIGRFFWEAAVTRGLTGGITGKGVNVNAISDKIGGMWDPITKTGSGIVGWLGKHNISPASNFGRNALQFTANLIGTIPEDILQASIDNVVTYNIDENKNLLNPDQMSENFKNNLIWMAAFNAIGAGLNTVKRARIAKQAAKTADMSQVLEIFSDADDFRRAMDKNQVKIEDGKVKVVDDNGKEKVLQHTDPEQVRAIITGEDANQPTFSRKVVVDNDGNIDFENFKRSYIEGDAPSSESLAALDEYQNESPVNIPTLNRYIRDSNQPDAKRINEKAQDLDMRLSNAFTRRIKRGGAVTYSGLTDSNLIEKFKNANVGDSVNFDLYLSTSAKPNIAQNFAKEQQDKIVLRIYSPEGTPVAYMPKDIDPLGDGVMENEILMPRGNDLTIVSKYDGNELGDGYDGMTVIDAVIERPRTGIDGADIDQGSAITKATDIETPKLDTSKIETPEAPKSEVLDVDGYTLKNVDDYINAPVALKQSDINVLHSNGVKSLMDDFNTKGINEFHNKFGDVRASDFDWVWTQSKAGMKPEEIIGTKDPETGRVITKNMIDAMEWWGEQPFTKDLRIASRNALGMEGDFNVLGYLPHTDYDPTNMSFEEAITGALWQTSTGASVLDDAGNYKGFGGDLEDRYRTFVSNMLWDARAKDVAATKLLDEVRMDGQEITPELETNARRVVNGEKDIQKLVNDNESTKATAKALSQYYEDPDKADWKKIDAETKKQAENSNLGQVIHDLYTENGMYRGADTYNVGKQGNTIVNSFDTLGNRMKNTTIGNGMSMYDWGGADIVYAPRNAIDIVNRFTREGGDFRAMLQEYVENHSHRSPEYAEEIVDKWMGKLGEIQGPLTKAKVIQSLGNSMKWEAMTRLKRWLTLAKYEQFNSSTKKMIDRFLFNHMQMDSIKHNLTIGKLLTKGLNDLTALRYRALFYGNIKNALLQTSELNRYFSSFKWGDVATMAKRLATDESFRARVDDYVQSVAPMTSQLQADIYNAYADVAGTMKVGQDGVTFGSLGKKAKETADAIGLGPIEAAEAFKNRMMVAGLVQEADRLGLTGDEALRYIRNRFERVALAADEMGQIGLASNPLAKTMLFLQNFQIRELGMHLYNIKDATGMAKTVPGRVLAATNYLTKVFGSKLATTLILARLGYSAKQTLGIDPLGLTDNYTGMDEEDMEWVDKQITGGLLTPFFAGGMTSLISDMYFMARKAYEDSTQTTVSEEAEQKLEPSWGLAIPNISFDDVIGAGTSFVPGSVFMNRINQMNEMMNRGWATSDSGNKMYTAPTDAFNTILGYLFGRSATQNAQQYNQSYGDNLWQTLGRFNPFREYTEFDPIDTKNYTDWFKGDANDRQQFEKGRRYFQQERDRIIDTYESVVSKSYASDDEISEAKNSMNTKLEELYDKLERFVDAYERKNGTIDSAMAKQLINLLNTGRNVVSDSPKEAEDRSIREYNKALDRYSALGLSPVGTYSGANRYNQNAETKYQGSPQYRSAVNNIKNQKDEVVAVLKLADETLAPIRKEISSAISNAYDRKNYREVERIQNEYLKQFDNVVSPIIASYGNGVLGSTDVTNQIKDMLSTGTNSRSGNLIPSSQYRKDKYGRYVSTPFETVDVKKWAQQRFSDKKYRNPTIRSESTVGDDISEIKRLSNNGQTGMAMARALQLKARVDSQIRTLSQEQYDWLNKFLEGGK